MFPIRYPPELPVSAHRETILAALRGHQVVIVAGETGSGKTTQLPKLCLETLQGTPGERRQIGCTQPRRVAALSVSRRVAEELGVTWGREVGCKIRFGDDTSRDTRVKFMTDGILLAEIQSDPLLRAYSVLIIDEAHERSLNIDFLLGYLKGLLPRRPDLRLVITSATIDTAAFSEAFGGAPVVEVSGRLFPVEIRYQPTDSFAPTADAAAGNDLSYIDAAVRAVEEALIESDSGDVLVFMPTERDIRETRDGLEGSLGRGTEILGLYGRMPAAEQTRIFSAGPHRRVIVATNIAETSLTIPRIRYVIDAGLSRFSRYNPRTRTKRLPVEPISQSSANQRAGRAGRVRDGICVRLYDQEDFEKRPPFTQPEIQRANLAEVILRMKAFRLGEIETFPFLNPPQTAAIRAGYGLLHELGALDDAHAMTPLGHELARLPLDPTLGRMLIQARHERALPEVLAIAAGLSVPDPREWPEDEKEAAAAAHKKFTDPESDFLTLLNLWRALPEGNGHGALRRFAKANYLSPSRLREWRDVHRQLAEVMDDGRNARPNPRSSLPPLLPGETAPAFPPGGFEAVHRAVLSGLLGQIAQRKERNAYQASGNRQVMVFPGSGLYQRGEKLRKVRPPQDGGPVPEAKLTQPPWIVAGEIVQTSQLFARTVARIAPEWVVDLGAHLCKFSYADPHWNEKSGRVLAWERVLIYGLEVVRRRIDYGKIDPAKATELFIRGALVAGEAHIEHHFIKQNRALRERVEAALTRVRDRRVDALDEAFHRFYAARIEAVSSLHDLNRLVRARIGREPEFLCADEETLLGSDEDAFQFDRALFPEQVPLGKTVLPVSYAYAPGEDRDGVTVRVPLPVAEGLTTGQVQWMVPGLREEVVGHLLRALPKTIRRTLMPLEPKVREVTAGFAPGSADFLTALAAYLSRRYGVEVRASDWPPGSLPAHLTPRVEVVDRANKTLAAGRDLGAVQTALAGQDVRSDAWDRAVKRWERPALANWGCGDLPETVVVEEVGGAPLLAYPGLFVRGADVDVRLFRRREEAEIASGAGVRRLMERALARDLAWVHKELGTLLTKGLPHAKKPGSGTVDFRSSLEAWSGPAAKKAAAPATSPGALLEAQAEAAYRHVASAALGLEPVFPLQEKRFQAAVERARQSLPLLARQTGAAVAQAREQRRQIVAAGKRYPGMEDDLRRLLPEDFPARTPPAALAQLPRYLKAVAVRAERAAVSPAKDAEKAKLLAPFSEWEAQVAPENQEGFRWLLEEYRVSVFAQELGTAQPVSAQRLRTLGGW